MAALGQHLWYQRGMGDGVSHLYSFSTRDRSVAFTRLPSEFFPGNEQIE
jgi:hypothetical protein